MYIKYNNKIKYIIIMIKKELKNVIPSDDGARLVATVQGSLMVNTALVLHRPGIAPVYDYELKI